MFSAEIFKIYVDKMIVAKTWNNFSEISSCWVTYGFTTRVNLAQTDLPSIARSIE
jgi:hypothetical protein